MHTFYIKSYTLSPLVDLAKGFSKVKTHTMSVNELCFPTLMYLKKWWHRFISHPKSIRHEASLMTMKFRNLPKLVIQEVFSYDASVPVVCSF